MKFGVWFPVDCVCVCFIVMDFNFATFLSQKTNTHTHTHTQARQTGKNLPGHHNPRLRREPFFNFKAVGLGFWRVQRHTFAQRAEVWRQIVAVTWGLERSALSEVGQCREFIWIALFEVAAPSNVPT